MRLRPILLSLYRILTVLAFVFSATVIVFMAFGFKYDVQQNKIEQTGIIIVNGSNKDLKVLLDGSEIAEVLPARILGVKEGYHSLEVQKEGFLPWKVDVNVINGEVFRVPFVLLAQVDPSAQFKPFMDVAGLFSTPVTLVGASKDSLIFKDATQYWFVDPTIKKKTRIDLPRNMEDVVVVPSENRAYGFVGTMLRAFSLNGSKVKLDHEEEFSYTREGLSFLQFTSNYQEFLFLFKGEIVSILRSSNDKVNFITRFVKPITSLGWFYDTHHFIVHVADKIQFCDETFTNCYVLHQLKSADSFAVDANGIYLYQAKEKKVIFLKLFNAENTFLSYMFSQQVSL